MLDVRQLELDLITEAKDHFHHERFEHALASFQHVHAILLRYAEDRVILEERGAMLNNAAACLHHLGRLDEAKQYYEAAKCRFQQAHPGLSTWVYLGSWWLDTNANQARVEFIEERLQLVANGQKPSMDVYLDEHGSRRAVAPREGLDNAPTAAAAIASGPPAVEPSGGAAAAAEASEGATQQDAPPADEVGSAADSSNPPAAAPPPYVVAEALGIPVIDEVPKEEHVTQGDNDVAADQRGVEVPRKGSQYERANRDDTVIKCSPIAAPAVVLSQETLRVSSTKPTPCLASPIDQSRGLVTFVRAALGYA